jgi:uncharacterized protein YbjT (DUF2867 family)
MMDDKVLVTGSRGLVGTEVVKELLERGVIVKATSRQGTEVAGAEATIFNFGKPETFAPALEGVDRVFLLVPAEFVEQGDELVPSFISELEGAGVRRVVCMTGMTAERPGAPMNRIEEAVKDSGISWTLVRPNWFNQNFAPGFYLGSIKAAGGVFLPAADGRVSFVDTRDIGAVVTAALIEDWHNGREYTLTGPEALDHAEACAILSEAAGREIRYVPVSNDDMRGALRQQGMPEVGIEGLVELYGLVRDGSCEVVSDDIATVLGRPPISLAQYAADHAELLR